MGGTLLEELADYVGFKPADAQILKAMGPLVSPTFPRLVDEFYAGIDRNPNARAVLRTEPQRDRLKHSLRLWLDGLVGGVYDQAYLNRRERIGRAHVRIKLEPRYVFASMNLIRRGLHDALRETEWSDGERAAGHAALDKICDIEVAIMMESYREGYIEQVRATERLATIGQLAASIAHELRNPLSVIESSLHLVKKRVPQDDRVMRQIARISEQVLRSTTIIGDLLALAKNRPPNRSLTDVRAVVNDAVAGIPGIDDVPISLSFADSLPLGIVDGSQLRQVVANLVINGVHSVRRVGRPGTVRIHVDYEEHCLLIQVDDDGAGLTPEVCARMFDPLFSTKAAGFGLGLALCREVIERHGGSISGENREEGGARFTVRVPDARAAR